MTAPAPQSLDTALALAAALLVLVALAATAFGSRQRRYDGWRWWMAALWTAAAGVALAALAAPNLGVLGLPASALLLLPPLMALAGLRHFNPRQALPGSLRLDGLLLAAALALRGLAEVLPPALGEPITATAVLSVYGYVAVVLLLGPGGREFVPVQALAIAFGLAGALPMAVALAGLAPVLPAEAVGATVAALALAFAGITLVCERTERQLRDSRRRLRTLANLDALTRVPNRRHFEELAERALTGDEPGTAALLQIDVDHFKRINDLFGHAAGDRALQLVSHAMLEQLRAQDVPGRQGGDEFVLLLRRTTPQQAMSVAQRIVAEVQRRAPQRRLPTLSLSVGIVQVGFGESVGTALRRADQALYEAKRQGRGRAVTAAGREDSPVFGESRPMGLPA